MSSTPGQEQPHLVSLVLQSKKALLHGQQICSHAHACSNSSARAAVDVLALDAKVRWISEAVVEQLKAGLLFCLPGEHANLVYSWQRQLLKALRTSACISTNKLRLVVHRILMLIIC